MAGLHITTSNMMEILAAHLADAISAPPTSPLSPEIVLINSRGMERWLSVQLADHHGVCANMSFQFPRPFLLDLLQRITGTSVSADVYHPDCLTWKIMKILPEMSGRAGFEIIRHYLGPDDDGYVRRSYQLSCRIARVFDQYLAYRPEMIRNWESDRSHPEDETWQATLWKALVEDTAKAHPLVLYELFTARMQDSDPPLAKLPERISLIGVSALPPFFIDVLLALSAWTDVYLFLFNPCREYWSEVLSERAREQRMKRLQLKTNLALTEEDLRLEKGNPLLASLGKISRDFLFALADVPAQHQDFFVRPGETTMLRTVQSDVLDLIDRSKGEAKRLPLSESDRSIECHACHSPLREVEVLHDRLLSLFESDAQLNPRDILVMSSDIDTYAPFIEAVFEHAGEETPKGAEAYIPFSIADRKHMRNNPVADIFFEILDLTESRFEVSRVLTLLESPMIRRAFHLSAEETALIRRWIDETGIRWGIDNQSLLDLDLPCSNHHTWRHGMERMLLGFALPGEDDRLFENRLPYDGIEGERAEVLGRFIDLMDHLFSFCKRLRERHSLKSWRTILTELCVQFLRMDEKDDTLFYYRHLIVTINNLSNAAETSGYVDILPLTVIREHLTEQLEVAGFSGGFLSGGVTFCAMVPMRSIPFKVIALLGMNHDRFPRESTKIGFDLIERHRRRGDRSKRDDDRYLFLETILSARERLILFYTGQSIRDNSLIPPSVVVSELLDYLEQSFTRKPDAAGETKETPSSPAQIRTHLLTFHPLQPFSPVYFSGDPRRFSYSGENCRAARSLTAYPAPARAFLSSPLPEENRLFPDVATTDLLRFFRHPARFFVEQCLGIQLRPQEERPDDVEAFTLSGLSRYDIAQTMLDNRLNAAIPDQEYHLLTEAGKLPLGAVGQYDYQTLATEINHYAGQIERLSPEANREEFDIDLTLCDIRLTGRITLPSPRGFFIYRYADLKGRDYLNAWLMHLCLFSRFPEHPWFNCLAGRKDWILFQAPRDGKAILMHLLNVYRDGLTRPLPFFPQTSLQYAAAIASGKSPAEALASARKVWQATDFNRGEEDDPYYRLCFRNIDPLDAAFRSLSEAVYMPLLTHRLVFTDADLLMANMPPIPAP